MLLVSGTFDIEGKTVLLVEDDAILAAEMGDAVTAAGGTVIGPRMFGVPPKRDIPSLSARAA